MTESLTASNYSATCGLNYEIREIHEKEIGSSKQSIHPFHPFRAFRVFRSFSVLTSNDSQIILLNAFVIYEQGGC